MTFTKICSSQCLSMESLIALTKLDIEHRDSLLKSYNYEFSSQNEKYIKFYGLEWYNKVNDTYVTILDSLNTFQKLVYRLKSNDSSYDNIKNYLTSNSYKKKNEKFEYSTLSFFYDNNTNYIVMSKWNVGEIFYQIEIVSEKIYQNKLKEIPKK